MTSTKWKNPLGGENKGVCKRNGGESLSTSIYIKDNHNCKSDLEKMLFIPINGKKPCFNEWNKPHNPNQLTYNEITDNNIGILTGYNNLLVIDVDSQAIEKDLLSVIPDTLVVKTGSDLPHKKHYYYYLDNPPTMLINDKSVIRLVDVLGMSDNGNYKMVLAPGAIHPDTGNMYYIEKDNPIHYITTEEWDNILSVLDTYNYQKPQNTKTKKNNDYTIFDYIKDNVDITEYMADNGISFDSRNKAKCPFHGDNKTKSLHNYQAHLYCYGCDELYTIIDCILKFENIEIKEIPKWFEQNYPKEFEEWNKQYNNGGEKMEIEEVHNNELTQNLDDEDVLYSFPTEVISGLAKDFVDIYTENSELSPTHCYLSFVSCVGNYLSTRLYLNTMGKTYPKLYTLLLGDSNSKKSSVIKQTTEFMKELDEEYNVCRGVGSGEGLLEYINTLGDTGDKKQVLLYYDEFKSFIDKAKIENSSLASHICSLFEDDKAENRTKNNKTQVKNVYMSILGACTYETWDECWSSNFTSQGLTNRFFLVPGKVDKDISFPTIDDDRKIELQKKLQTIIDNVGIDYNMSIDNTAMSVYNKWYKQIKYDYENINHNKRIEWYCLKLAMIISLLNEIYTITKESIEKAIKICEWQTQVRKCLEPIDADTLDGKIEGKIIKCLMSTDVPLTDRDINEKTKVKSRNGSTHYSRVRQSLLKDGTLIEVKNTKNKNPNAKSKLWISDRDLPANWEKI